WRYPRGDPRGFSSCLRSALCTASRTRRSVRDMNSADGDVWSGSHRCGRRPGVRINQAGGDHGAAVPGRVAHFLDILADELVGGFRMPGIDLAHIGDEDFRIDPA